jgi:hypothetical protein
LPVRYFHLVFTLPHELSRLALANRRVVYDLLFAAAQTVQEVAADPKHLGAQVGLMLVLHTWGQNLEHHPHVHGIAPAGGLSLDGSRWVACRERFFLPVKVLSRLFRGKFLAGLHRAHQRGELKLDDKLAPLAEAGAFARSLSPLYRKEWVVYVEPPVGGTSNDPEPVLKYLARYVYGVAIANQRLLALEKGQVTFAYKDYRRGRQRRTMTLDAFEFIRRFLQHVVPPRFVRIRCYGLLAPTRRRADLARCRALLAAPPAPATPPAVTLSTLPAAPNQPPRCRVCGIGELLIIDEQPRPTLWQLLARPLAPALRREPDPPTASDTS